MSVFWCNSAISADSPDVINRVKSKGYYMAAEIRHFSSSVEKYFTNERSERMKYF